MVKLPVILNTFIVGFFCFFITYLLLISISINKVLSCVLAIVFSLSIAIIIMIITNNFESVKKDKKTQSINIQNYQKTFNLMDSNSISKIISEFFDKVGISYKIIDNYFQLKNDEIFLPLFLPNLTYLDLAKYLKHLNKQTKIYIVADSFDKQLKQLKNNFVFIDSKTFIKQLLQENVTLPPIIITKKDFSFLFSKQIGKKSIAYGILLLVMSIFVFYPIYYIVFGSLFIIYGITTLFFAKQSFTKQGLEELLNKPKKDK